MILIGLISKPFKWALKLLLLPLKIVLAPIFALARLVWTLVILGVLVLLVIMVLGGV